MICDMCFPHCRSERCLHILLLFFLFSGDDVVLDRYDYMGYGLEYEEYDDEC